MLFFKSEFFREDVFKTTLVHLTERFNGKEVFLVGTMNQSTMLAQRTEKLIQELKPDEVMVQTSSEWWDAARSLKYVDSQDEFNAYGADLEKFEQKKMFDFFSATRVAIFQARIMSYYYLMQYHFRFGPHFRFTRPGLEIRNAC